MARVGRPSKPYPASWGDDILGLTKCGDGRWRCTVNGKEVRFSEENERRAVERFNEMTGKTKAVERVAVEMKPSADGGRMLVAVPRFLEAIAAAGVKLTGKSRSFASDPRPSIMWGDRVDVGYDLDPEIVWPWVLQQLADKPAYVAKMLHCPALADPDALRLRKTPIRISDIIRHYEKSNPSQPKAKKRCVQIFQGLVDHACAKTLADLTTDVLMTYRQSIESSTKIKSGGTKKWMYGQIKSLISFGLKCGLDEPQIQACLNRCNVLWTATPTPAVDPKPISRDDLHKLLKAAGDGPWRAWILVGLNCAMSIDEVCALRWSEIDESKWTYATIRNKTKEDRVPRAAVYWTETIAAVKSLSRFPKYVFTSKHGTRFNVQSRCNEFRKLCDRAGVSSDVSFGALKDGAYNLERVSPESQFITVLL